MSRDGLWTYAHVGEELWNNNDYDTQEEAIEAGIEWYKEWYKDEYGEELPDYEPIVFEVGQLSVHVPYVCADWLIDQLQEDAYENCGESGEGFLYYITKREVGMLEERLNEALNQWLEDIREEPNFYSIENIKTIHIGGK